MTTHTVSSVETTETPGPRITLWLLRGLTPLLTIAILAQPALAGGYLSGEFDLLTVHRFTAIAIDGAGMALLVLALGYWLIGRGSPLPLLLSIALFLAASFQTGMGFARVLFVHIPLGVALVLLTLALCWAVFRRAARDGRPRRVRTEVPA